MMVPSVQEASMKSVEIDRGKRLKDQPATGHNRFHPDVPPILSVDEGEEVVLATRDGVDGQLGPSTSEADMANMEAGAIHPLTGPVFVKGARPGDTLEIEFLDIVPQPHAFTAIVPGARLPARSLHHPVPGPLADPRRLGDVIEAAWSPDPRRAVHGRVRRCALGGTSARVDHTRERSARPRRVRFPTRRDRRRSEPRAGGDRGNQNIAAT